MRIMSVLAQFKGKKMLEFYKLQIFLLYIFKTLISGFVF